MAANLATQQLVGSGEDVPDGVEAFTCAGVAWGGPRGVHADRLAMVFVGGASETLTSHLLMYGRCRFAVVGLDGHVEVSLQLAGARLIDSRG